MSRRKFMTAVRNAVLAAGLGPLLGPMLERPDRRLEAWFSSRVSNGTYLTQAILEERMRYCSNMLKPIKNTIFISDEAFPPGHAGSRVMRKP